MLSRAAVAVAAGADLVVETAVDLRALLAAVCRGTRVEAYLVLFGTEDGGEVVRHFD